jgi:choline-sulfatase
MASNSSPTVKAVERPVLGVLLLVTVAALVAGGFSLWHATRGPQLGSEGGFRNLMLVTFDTTRADHIGAYGYLPAHTPNIDRMAESGVTFDHCITVAPITLPSHASILTGLYPFNHGARNNGTHSVPEDVTTLAETLSDNDFATAAVVSALVLDSKYGLDQGFGVYDDNLANAEKAPMFMFRETKALDTARRALRWIQLRGPERWFLWVHFFDPHANYAPPENYAKLCPDSPYDGEIAYADAGLGEILEGLRRKGLVNETLVVMTADHGEALGDHGESTHSMFIYDSTTRVPLVMMHPALARGKRVREVVSSVDIVPTALELLGVEPGVAFDGRSTAMALFDYHSKLEPVPAYSEAMSPYYNHGWSDLRGLRDERVRYVRAPRPEIYDLPQDPWEDDNLLPGREDLADPRETLLAGWLSGGERDVRDEDILTMDPDQREALAALGYVWSSDGLEDIEDSERADPKDRVHMWEKSQRAHGMMRNKKFDEAEFALREVLAEDPGAIMTRGALAQVLVHQDRFQEAHDMLVETTSLPGVRNNTLIQLAALEREMGLSTWSDHLGAAKALDSRDPMPFVREGDWAQEDGDPDGAIAAYRASLDLDERFAKAWIGIGNTEHRRGNDEEALRVLLRAIEVDPIAVEAWYDLGVVLEALGRQGEARTHYEKAVELEPTHALSLVNLANLFSEGGDEAGAEALYRRALAESPDLYSGNFNLAMLLIRTERPALASELLAHAVTLEPERPEAWLYWIMAARRAGDHEGVLAAVEGMLILNPGNAAALSDAAMALEALGRREEALERLSAALEANEERVRARAGKVEDLRVLLELLDR